MPKLLRLTSAEAEKLLLSDGFELIRTKGSHRIYQKSYLRMVIPFHSQKSLHPKIIKRLYEILTPQTEE